MQSIFSTKSTKKLQLMTLALLSISILALWGCDPWARLKNAKTIAIVSIESNQNLQEFLENGDLKKNFIGADIGMGEAASIAGGLFSGKVVEKAQEALDKRTQNEKQTYDNKLKFEKAFPGLMQDVLTKSRFEVKPYDYLSGIDLRDEGVAKGLLREAGTDVIVLVKNTFGYIRTDKNFGLTKEYQLVLECQVAGVDKEGYLGAFGSTRKYFVKSNNRLIAEAGLPVFTEADYNSLMEQLLRVIKSDLISIKLK